VEDVLEGRPASEVSAKFHLSVVNLITAVARKAREERRLGRVALSGGVFQNRFLTERAVRSLEAQGFEVLRHGRVPPNDGGISLGQAAVANARLAAGRL
jgi:hydrogenase maturation protein HypF